MRSLAVIIAALWISGCSGAAPSSQAGAGATLPSVTHAGAPAVRGGARSAHLTIRVKVPRHARKHRIRVLRNGRPEYISVSTQAMTLAITGPTNVNVVIGLTSLATGCKSLLGAIVCTFALSLAPCPSTSQCYSANVTTYDQYDPSTNTVPGTAQVLSVADGVTFNVAIGTANTLGFTLSGVPARVAAVPLDNEATVRATSMLLAGVGSHQFYARAYDADGNLITGGGAPVFSFGLAPLTNLVVQYYPANGRFTIQPKVFPSTSTLTVQASYVSGETDACSQPSAVCSIAYSVIIQQPIAMYTAGFGASIGPGPIAAGPDGNLWFTEYAGDSVDSITTGGTMTRYTAGIDASSGPSGIATGADGNIWFTELLVSKIGKITAAGGVTEYSTGLTPGAEPDSIAAGSDGNLWFNEASAPKIGKITTSGMITEYSGGLAGATLFGITGGPDGNLWFTDYNGKVGKITTTGMVTEYSTGLVPGAHPAYITSGPDGNLWFTDYFGYVGKVSTSGSITEYPATLPPGMNPYFIAPGPDGNVWFTGYMSSAGAIARITTSGTVTVFNVPTGFGSISGIAPGYDGNMWFTGFTPSAAGTLQI